MEKETKELMILIVGLMLAVIIIIGLVNSNEPVKKTCTDKPFSLESDLDNRTLTVSSIDTSCDNLNWENVVVDKGINAAIIFPTGGIKIGDIITNCSGEIVLIWEPTKVKVGVYFFDEYNTSKEENNTTKTDEEKIIGMWSYTGSYEGNDGVLTYTFFSDNAFELTASYKDIEVSSNGTWNITENELVFTAKNQEVATGYSFSDDDKILTIFDSEGNSVDFTKQ